ncbi:acyltransferase [uncultured Caulobacter sp.]|uniref:acyltransferase family protein n=1 Tax=uncultured Caulobacter sp. TaxID=158749 RepID=UPI00261F0C38|nr:acyltransferase [uncultured Caulobacter sp.]
MYPSDIRPLTSLRICAALWVLVYHFRNHLDLGLDRFGLAFKGYLGVDLFFILSGFILSHVYTRAWAERRFHYGSFLWARLARVYPVHLVTLGATIAIWLVALRLGVGFEPQAFDPRMLPQHLLLVHAWGTTPTVQWNFPSWSISAEWFAYLCFPVAAMLSMALRQRPRLMVLGALLLFAVMFLIAQARGVLFTDMSAQIGALRIIPAFLMGAALHRLGSSVTVPSRAAVLGALAATAWVATAASLRLNDLYIWPALALLIFCLAETSKTSGGGVMAAPILVHLGEVSYGVYMVHLPVDIVYFHGLGRIAPNLSGVPAALAWGGAFVACLLAAMMVYHGVERPARNWLRAHDPFARRPIPEPPREPVL